MRALAASAACAFLMLLLGTQSTTLARPDCNACFMKNAGKDLKDVNHQSQEPSRHIQGIQGNSEEAEPSTQNPISVHRERVLRSKRTVGWGQEIQNRLRDELFAEKAEMMRAGAEEDSTPGQWWEDAPTEVDRVDPSSPMWSATAAKNRPHEGQWGHIRG